MDFAQRNLINERNDLQVELAKAKLLIAELSEAYRSLPQESIQQPRDKATWKAIGNRTSERKGVVSNKKENLVSDNVQGLSDPAAAAQQRVRDIVLRARARSEPARARARADMSTDIGKKPISEQAEYISDLENVIMSIAESMNMSVEDLLNEGEMRNIRLQKALQKAGDNVRIGNTKLAAMDSHVRDVATTQGGSAGQAADNALSRQKGKTKVAVSQAIEKSTKLRSALDTSTNQVRNSRAARVARGYFSDSPNQQRQASRISSIGNERNNPQASNNTTGNTSSDSLAAQGKLPSKKFGSPVNQRMSLSATRSDSKFARSNQAQAQSDAAKARNQANKPV